jgi:hypothetical protein
MLTRLSLCRRRCLPQPTPSNKDAVREMKALQIHMFLQRFHASQNLGWFGLVAPVFLDTHSSAGAMPDTQVCHHRLWLAMKHRAGPESSRSGASCITGVATHIKCPRTHSHTHTHKRNLRKHAPTQPPGLASAWHWKILTISQAMAWACVRMSLGTLKRKDPDPQDKSNFIRGLEIPGAKTYVSGVLARCHTNPDLGPR